MDLPIKEVTAAAVRGVLMLDLFALVVLAVIFSPLMLRFSSPEDES